MDSDLLEREVDTDKSESDELERELELTWEPEE
jgi:hypothetical protein